MNGDILGLLLGAGDQVQGEALHLAFLAVVGGVSAASAVISYFVRRDIKRNDADKKAMAAGILDLGRRVDALKDKHGSEISDTRLALERAFAKLGLDQWDYPSR